MIVRLIGVIGVKADVAGAVARWIIIAFSILAAARYLNLGLDLLWPKFIDFWCLPAPSPSDLDFLPKRRSGLKKLKVVSNDRAAV